MFHIFHFLQSDMVFGIANPFWWLLNTISSEKSCLISMSFLFTYIDIRTVKFLLPAEFWLVNSNFRRPNHMQGYSLVERCTVRVKSQSTTFTCLCLCSFPAQNYSTLERKVKRPSAAGVNFLTKFFQIKSKFIQQYEFLEKLDDFFGKSCWRARSRSLITSSIQMALLIYM